MPIDPDVALAAAPVVRELAWSTRDVLLYHLSLGAGRSSDPELPYTFERDLRVLPTFALVAGKGISAGADDAGGSGMAMPGIDIDLRRILHSGQQLTAHQPLPPTGRARLMTRVAAVHDKGKAAVVELEHAAHDDDGAPLWTSRMQIWARGEGGFSGDPGPRSDSTLPSRAADEVIEVRTALDQARLYRLNGDLNPLHIDPRFARNAGFDRPILHGLASYGIVAKALVDRLGDGDPARLRSLAVRFAGPVTPGETLRTSVWHDAGRLVVSTVCPDRDDAAVLTHGSARLDPA